MIRKILMPAVALATMASAALAADSTGPAVNWTGYYAGAQIGYAMGNTLVYATGGLGYEHLKASIVDPGVYTGASTKSRWGWTLGAGVEYAINRNWSVKGEYMYYNFGKKNDVFGATEVARAKNDIHTVKLGVNYRFGGYDAPVVAKY